MAVLGIESSAHTLGVGIVENGKILANERIMYKITDKGIIPSKVADFHAGNVREAILSALERASLRANEIDAIGYTKGPGIGACLQIGYTAALSLSQRLGVPILPVNHAVAHIEIAKAYAKLADPLALYVSGGNSQILRLSVNLSGTIIYTGETFDIGIGNMLEILRAQQSSIQTPWGVTVAKAAANGKAYISMPYTVKGMDFTFTGLLTNATELLERNSVKDISYSLQETAFSMLCEATEGHYSSQRRGS